MFDTIEEIKKLISEKEATLSELRAQMDDDFDLFSLTPYEPKDRAGNVRKGYQAYTSTAPRNFFDKVLDGVNRAALTIAIKLPEKASKEKQKAASEGELYLFGALHDVDQRQALRGEPPLREALGFLMCLRGRVALRALVYIPKGEEDVVFDVQPWDPMHVTWEQGSKGLVWTAYKRKATKAQILSEYGITIEKKEEDIIDFFDEENNSVIVGGVWAKEPTPHGIGRVPVFVGAVGSMPTIQTKDFASTLEHQGDSVWAVSRGLYEPFNKHISELMDIHERAKQAPLTYESEDGTKGVGGDPYESREVIRIKKGEVLAHLPMPEVPASTGAILGVLQEDKQQSSLPFPIAYGGTRQAQSGISLSIQLEATRSVYNPRTALMVRAHTWLCEELLAQFHDKGTKARELTGYDYRNDTENGVFFRTTSEPEAIDPSWHIEVKCEPRMPRDEQTEIVMANMARQPGGVGGMPLMSLETILERILKVRDPHAEIDKIKVEMGEALAPVQIRLIAAALREAGREDAAREIEALLRRPGGDGAAPTGPGGPQGAPPIPPELVQAILQELRVADQADVAIAFKDAVEGRTPLTPQLLEEVVRILMESGQRQLAQTLLQVLGVVPPGGAPTEAVTRGG